MAKLPVNGLWLYLAGQTDHVAWRGLAFWDLIQPSFMFIVGVAMPWAYANRKARGQGWWSQFGHAVARSLVLIALGVFLSSNGSKQTNWTFVNVLTQIGLGYTFVFLILGWKPPWQWAAAVAVLVGYWAYFAFWPLPGGSGTWPMTPAYATLSEHWAKNANAASAFDLWFLNLLPYPDGSGFKENGGGYATLNFIPSIATAIFGVLVRPVPPVGTNGAEEDGERWRSRALRRSSPGRRWDYTICPSVRRIWSPSWVVVSTGWACVLMAAFSTWSSTSGPGGRWRRSRWWSWGPTPIVMYVMAQLIRPWVKGTLRTHLTTGSYVLSDWLGLAAPKVEKSGTLFDGTYGPVYEQGVDPAGPPGWSASGSTVGGSSCGFRP